MFILDKPIWKMLSPDEGGGGGGDDGESQGKEKVPVPTSEGFKDFNKRFSASAKAPTQEGGDPKSQQNKEIAEGLKADAEKQAADRAEQAEESKKIGDAAAAQKPKPFIKQQIEAKRGAEKERDDLKAKVSELEKSVSDKQELVNDLQKKIDSGQFSEGLEQKMEAMKAEVESSIREEREALVNENKQLKSKLSVVDLAETDEFKKTYLAPVQAAHQEAAEILGDNENHQQAFERALLANSAAMRAQTNDMRMKAERERDTLLSQIVESLPQFTGNRFTSAVNEYIRNSFKYASAIRNHEVTAKKLREDVRSQQDQAYAERLSSWGKTFKNTYDNYKQDSELTSDQIKSAKSAGYDVESELKKHDNLASKTISGEATMPDSIDIVHKGRIYPALKARLMVLENSLKERDDLIKKLRGAQPGGESNGGSARQSGEKQTREEWQRDKFGAGRTR